MPQDQLEHYLNTLGVQRRPPSVEALCELVQAHMLRVPFENISKLYYKQQGRRSLPSLDQFLTGIDRFNFGGTCYSNNYYLYQLLANLDYQIVLCGADMSNPDVHVVSLVIVEQREYLVDVGYAAPFLTPLPRDLTTDYMIALGHDRYVLKPQDDQRRSRLELYREGNLKHGYVVKPVPRQIGDFDQVITDSYRDAATFMNAILLARFFLDRSIVIHNLTVIEARGTELETRTLANRDALVQAIYDYFGIPEEITLDAMKGLELSGDAWN